jgi:galactose oxidase
MNYMKNRGRLLVETASGGSIQLTTNEMPAANLNPPYKLSATYTAPQTFDAVNPPVNAPVAAGALAPVADPADVGQWTEIIPLPNVPIHTHLLPTGKVLFWGRRTPPGALDYPSLNQHSTQAFEWDPANPNAGAKPTKNAPTDTNGNPINLFCAGHTFLADGTLMVTGGHLFDSQGIDTTTFYDPIANQWSAKAPMNNGRWYPSAITLADGTVFVCGGTFAIGTPGPPPNNNNQQNNISQVFENDKWVDVRDFTGLPFFPRLHLAPNGAIFMSGALAQSFFLEGFDASRNILGNWVGVSQRSLNNADYATSVMYDVGKVIFMGGGGATVGEIAPANVVETIDLNAANPAWATVTPMNSHRRQHNATILADGTVLVTGGNQAAGFDSLGPNQTIRIPELWDPHTGIWTEMATEAVDRCYHSTAVLLPDGTVFSGGGGEYDPDNTGVAPNPPINTHANFQIFSPPYLFRGARPTIANPPASVLYGQTFDIGTPEAAEIAQVTWIRLSSVTHSFNSNQRINFLAFQAGAGKLTITAPADGNVCPPGHYLLFVLNQKKVPSEAAIVQITVGPAAALIENVAARVSVSPFPVLKQKTVLELDADIQAKEKQPPVVVGVTAGCPYGISACWGGAYESLNHLNGVRLVRPVPNADDSTAYVYLKHNGLPNLDVWPSEFARMANGTHVFRGVEVTVTGVVSTSSSGSLLLEGNDTRPPLVLSPIEAADKIQWDATKSAPQSLEPVEQNAFSRLLEEVKDARGSVEATITGPLKKDGSDFYLEVREFRVGS